LGVFTGAGLVLPAGGSAASAGFDRQKKNIGTAAYNATAVTDTMIFFLYSATLKNVPKFDFFINS
jgi:hypothetical protein